jgi:hypothetical protein
MRAIALESEKRLKSPWLALKKRGMVRPHPAIEKPVKGLKTRRIL